MDVEAVATKTSEANAKPSGGARGLGTEVVFTLVTRGRLFDVSVKS